MTYNREKSKYCGVTFVSYIETKEKICHFEFEKSDINGNDILTANSFPDNGLGEDALANGGSSRKKKLRMTNLTILIN